MKKKKNSGGKGLKKMKIYNFLTLYALATSVTNSSRSYAKISLLK